MWKLIARRSRLSGEVTIPGSKSHTIRAVAIASLAEGESEIRAPLLSEDTRAAVEAYRALGAEIEVAEGVWRVRGFAGHVHTPDNVIDVRNSGVTLRTAMGTCALLTDGPCRTHRRRPDSPAARRGRWRSP